MATRKEAKRRSASDDSGAMEDSWRAAFALRLKRAIGEQTIADFARLIDWHPETVRRYLAGDTRPPAEFLAKICQSLDISPDWLLLGNGPMLRRERDATALDAASLGQVLEQLQEFIESPRPRMDGGKPRSSHPSAKSA